MTHKSQLAIFLSSFTALSICLGLAVNSNNNVIDFAKADPTSYSLTLDKNNAPIGLTNSFQKNVNASVETSDGNEIVFKLAIAKAMDNGFVTLGNNGTISCIRDDNKHISGLTAIKVNYSGGALTMYSSSVSTTDGSSYVTDAKSLPNNTLVNLTDAANSFVLKANDANINISSINLEYSCATNSTEYDFTQNYNVEDFEAYTATGVGYDSSHGMGATTNLRAAFYSTYNGGGSNPISGTGWNIMGSTDYLTYKSTGGVNDSKHALLKVNSGNYFSYVQAKHFFGVNTAIGKGRKLSVMLKGGMTSTSGDVFSGSDTKVNLVAYYNKQLDTTGVNDAVYQTVTVPHGSDWGEYTLDIDPNKTVYAFGIHLVKAGSGTIYLPIDNVRIYTDFDYTGYPSGVFTKTLSILSYKVLVLFAFSDDKKDLALVLGEDMEVTSYTYNLTTKQFSIATPGQYLGYTVGTINGTYDPVNNKLVNVTVTGSIKSLINNVEVPLAPGYWNCDGSTSELQATFKRRYNVNTVDTTNADRIVSATYDRISGTNSMRFRLYKDGLSQLNLNNDISISARNIGFWVYSSFSEDKTIRLWRYTGASLSNADEIGSGTAKAGQWHFVHMGFNDSNNVTVKNFQIAFNQYNPNNGYILIDDICVF